MYCIYPFDKSAKEMQVMAGMCTWLYMCMYVYMYVCMYVCMYLCVYVRTFY